MPPYHYPYTDFTRDFDAVLPSPNAAAPSDETQTLAAVCRYVHATYPNEADSRERAEALATAWLFISRHMDQFDIGRVAVRGTAHSIISEHLLRAVHTLVCSAASAPSSQFPTPQQVRELAERYIREDGTRHPNTWMLSPRL